jgi:hypothetical protein
MNHLTRWSGGAAAFWCLAAMCGCASSKLQKGYENTIQQTPPSVVLIYKFYVSSQVIKENQSIIAKGSAALSSDTAEERQEELGREVQESLAQDLVDGVNALGIPARHADSSLVPANAVLIQGQFASIDEGNRLRRNIIGFGSGQSTVDATVVVSQITSGQQIRLLHFATHADSGAMPGALVTGGAGAAAGAGTAAVLGANAGLSIVKSYRSQVAQLASKSADQTVAYLSEYFARQGWISQDKARSPSAFGH